MTMPNPSRRWFQLGFAALFVVVMVAFAILEKRNQSPKDPLSTEQRFTKITGLRWPDDAKVVRAGDDHGGFMREGEFYVVFDADAATLESWLAKPAPWGAVWQDGPVPDHIGAHGAFGTSGFMASVGQTPPEYSGDRSLVELLQSATIKYAAVDRNSGRIPWHNGNLIVIDMANHRVWLSLWDF